MVNFDASKYPPPPSEIAAYQVTDPTICRSECWISDQWVWLSESVVKPFVWWGCYDVVFFLAFAPQLSREFRHVYDLSDQLQQAWLQSVLKKWTSIRQYRCGIVPKHVTPKRAVKLHELRFCSHKNVKNKIRRTYFLRSLFTNGWVLKHWTFFFASQSYDAQEYAPTTSSKPW